MLQRASNLDLHELSRHLYDDVDCPVAEAGVRSTINYRRSREGRAQGRYDLVLGRHVGHDDSAPGNILDLSESDALAMQFLY